VVYFKWPEAEIKYGRETETTAARQPCRVRVGEIRGERTGEEEEKKRGGAVYEISRDVSEFGQRAKR